MVTNALRIARVPFSGGAVVVTLEARSDTIRSTDQAFNELLLSLRAGLDGRAPEPQKFLSEL